jgi:hypothetical protein
LYVYLQTLIFILLFSVISFFFILISSIFFVFSSFLSFLFFFQMPNGTDKSFIDKLHNSCAQAKPYAKVLSNPQNFMVKHYAGQLKK